MIRPETVFGLTPPTLAPLQDISSGVTVPPQAFTWSNGGTRLSPEDIAYRRKMAQGMTAAGLDFSPIQSWTQGLARVAQALIGRDETKKLDKASAANANYQQQIAQSLIGAGDKSAVAAAALTDPYAGEGVQDLAKMQLQASYKTPPQPHYWETNNGSLAVVGPDGKPQILYNDPTPKIDWITAANPDGTKTLVPVGPNGPMQQGGGGPVSTVPRAPVGKLTPIGGAGSGPQTFPIR